MFQVPCSIYGLVLLGMLVNSLHDTYIYKNKNIFSKMFLFLFRIFFILYAHTCTCGEKRWL